MTTRPILPALAVIPAAIPADIEALRQPLNDVAVKLGLALSSEQAGLLIGFLALLRRWNLTYNLTSVREPAAMLSQHVADCLAVIEPLRRNGLGSARRRVLDVGSGGGLPGVVIAVMNPEVEVVCVDAVGKKTAFVRQVAAALGLPNLRSEHSRVELLAEGGFDVVVSRAFGSLADFVTMTRRHLAPDGVWMAMKGKAPEAEMVNLPADVVVFHVEQLHVPGLDAERRLVWMAPNR